jgi:hypothetical protein
VRALLERAQNAPDLRIHLADHRVVIGYVAADFALSSREACKT